MFRQRNPLALSALLLLASACQTTGAPKDEDIDPPPGPVACKGTPFCETCTHGPLERWQRPIQDYAEAYKKALDDGYKPAIDGPLNLGVDLEVFDCRLYLGYGDANVNAAQVVPIEIRSWQDPKDAAPAAEDPGTGRSADLSTREEQIGRFRVFGETLYWAGPDAADDEWLGNVFVRPGGGTWARHRAVPGGVHVHDVAAFGDSLFACGSGAIDKKAWEALGEEERAALIEAAAAFDRVENPSPEGFPNPDWRALTKAHWDTGQIQSILWESRDQGQTWEPLRAIANTVRGDRRFTQLLPLGGALHIFGYRTDEAYEIAEFLSYTWSDEGFKRSQVLPADRMVTEADRLDESAGLLRLSIPEDLSETSQHAWLLREGGVAEPIPALQGRYLFDVAAVEGGLLVLSADLPLSADSRFRVSFTKDLVEFRDIWSDAIATAPSWPTRDLDYVVPTSVAWWEGALYVGFANGEVWRSPSQEAAP